MTVETTAVDDHATLSILAKPIADRGETLVLGTDHVVVKVFIARSQFILQEYQLPCRRKYNSSIDERSGHGPKTYTTLVAVACQQIW